MEDDPARPFGAGARGFLLCLLSYAQGLAVLYAVSVTLPGSLLNMKSVGVAAVGAGVVVAGMIFALGLLAAAVMGIVSGVLLRRSGRDLSAPAAALALNVFQVGHFADHFSPTLFWSLAAATGSILGVWATPNRIRSGLSFVVIFAALLSIGILQSLDKGQRIEKHRLDDIGNVIETHAESREDELLRRDLDVLRDPVDLVFALELLVIRGDYLPQIDIILEHPHTPRNQCIQVLRGEADFNGFTGNDNARYTEICATLAAVLGARWNNPKILAAGIAQLGPDAAVAEPLFILVRVDRPAALRMLRAAHLLDSRGKVDPRYYNAAFVGDVWNRLEGPQGREFISHDLDLDALLVATLWWRGEPEHPAELLKAGANPNYRSLCGATPLTALVTGALSNETLDLLMKAGANADLPGAERCLGEAHGQPVLQKPLTLLLRRAKSSIVLDEEMSEWRKILGR